MTRDQERQLKARFIPSSADTKAHADDNNLPRDLARQKMINNALIFAATNASTVEELRDVVLASLLLKR